MSSFFEKLLETKLPPAPLKKAKGFSSEHPLIQEARILVENVKNSLIKNRIKENTKDIEITDESEKIEEIPTTSKKPLKTVVKTSKGKVSKSTKKTQKRAK